MKRYWTILGGIAVLAALGTWALRTGNGPESSVFEAKNRPAEPAALCPWRDPEADLAAFFPPGAVVQETTRLLSGRVVELNQRLGRPPQPEELALHVYEVKVSGEPAGVMLLRRVKASHGAMELVVAFDVAHRVLGVRVQRSREPEEIRAIVESKSWLAQFRGMNASSHWNELPTANQVPDAARGTAAAVVDGVRSVAILLELAHAREDHKHH